MAVVHCKDITGRDGSDDTRKNKRYSRTFQILTDSPLDGAKLVLACPDLPAIGDTWETVDDVGAPIEQDLEAFCVDRKATSSSRDLYQEWMVTCDYVGRGDPTLEPAEVDWSCVKYQVAMQKDINGSWVRNSAGDPFAGGITRDRTRFTVMIRKNVLSWDPIDALSYIDTLNEDAFLSTRYPPGFNSALCKLSELNATAVWLEDFSDIHYWKRQAKVEIDVEGWDVKVLDAGFRKLVAGVPKPIIDAGGGGKISSPALLDGSGGVIAPAGTPHFQTFAAYSTKDWSPLALDY